MLSSAATVAISNTAAGSSAVGGVLSSTVSSRSRGGRRSMIAQPSTVRVAPTRAVAKGDDTPAAAAAAPTGVALPRRAALTAALASACTLIAPATTATSPACASTIGWDGIFAGGSREFDFKTYKLTVPDVYEEVSVPLKDPATGAVSPTVMLLKDTRAGQAGNTISLSKQIIPEGGIKSVADIGSAQDAGTLLVAAEAARKKGSAASFRSASQRTGGPGNALLYYTAEYTKSVLTVSRVVLTTLVVADGVLYTLTAEEDQGRFDGEMGDALRAAAASLVVIAQNPAPAAAAPAEPAAAKGGKKRR